jgi:mycofactocin precursor
MMTTKPTSPESSADDLANDESPVSAEALIEEVSIDGMCGVY